MFLTVSIVQTIEHFVNIATGSNPVQGFKVVHKCSLI